MQSYTEENLTMEIAHPSEHFGKHRTECTVVTFLLLYYQSEVCTQNLTLPYTDEHCATSRKVEGSIPDGVIESFIDIIVPAALWPWG